MVYFLAVGYGLGGVLLRAVVCVICLLLFIVLMGVTLLVVACWTGTTRTGVAQIGWLYVANTIGVVVGVFIASFYLLRVHDTVVVALAVVGLNGVVALVALRLAVSSPGAGVSDPPEPAPVPAPSGVLAVIGLSGFAVFGAEVVWTR